MKKDAITFPTLIARLERAIHHPCGERGFQILLYGWITKYGKVTRAILNSRKKGDKSDKSKKSKKSDKSDKSDDNEYWLTLGEATHFSNYVGYDLTHD